MRVSWRRFSAPDFDSICEDVPSDILLSAPTAPTTLVVGEPFDLEALGVVATDQDRTLLAGVPVTVQVREQPPLLDVQAFRAALGPIVPVTPGDLMLRVRTLCSETPAEVLVPVVVVKR